MIILVDWLDRLMQLMLCLEFVISRGGNANGENKTTGK
jgi:hypothetical protein